MKKYIIFVFCVLLPVLIYPVQFLVSPPKIEVDMSHSGIVNDTVVIMNRDTTNITIKCYLRDWGYKEGKKYFTIPGSLKWSASNWITVNPLQFKLLPYEKKTVRITIQKPKNAEKFEYRSMLFFESIAKPTKYSRSFLFSARIGVPIYVETSTKSYNGFIKGIDIKGDEIKLTYVNDSNNRLYLKGKYSIVDNINKDTVKTDSIGNELVLPMDTQRIYVNIKDLKKGDYYVYFYIDNGGENVYGGKKRFKRE